METPCPPPSNSQIFIHGAIFLKFETEHFYMFIYDNLEYNLYMEVPLPPVVPLKEIWPNPQSKDLQFLCNFDEI